MSRWQLVSFWLIALFGLVGCSEQALKLDTRFNSSMFRITASATDLVFDGTDLTSQIDLVIKGANGLPVVGYAPEITVEQLTSFSMFGLFNATLSVNVNCTATNGAGESTCTLTVPPPAGAPEKVVVKIAGQALSFTSPLIIYPAPTITAVSDSSLSYDQGQSLTITGTQFRTGMKVYIDALLCTPITVTSATSAQCTTPVHAVGGPYDVDLEMPDEQEISLAASVSFQDVTAPTVDLTLVTPTRSNEASFDFEFTGADNLTIVGNLTYECQVNSGGWSNCTSPNTAAGFNVGVSNTFSVRVTDEAGNTGVDSHSWIYDTTAPTITIAVQTSLSPTPSSSLAARTVTFGGTDIEQYKYEVIRAGTCAAVDYLILTAQNISSPTISFTPTTDGTYTVCAIGKDSAGNWQAAASATASSTLTIDTVVEPFAALAVTPASPATNNKPTVTGTTEANIAVVLYKQTNCAGASIKSGTTNGIGEFSLTPTASIGANNSYALSVKATDDAGNTLCSNDVPYILDTVVPTLTLISMTGGQYIRGGQSNDIAWTVSDSGSGLAATPITLEYSLNDGSTWSTIVANTANSSPYAWNMPGFNSTAALLRITAVDAAGNSKTVTSSSNFTIDSTAPLLSLDNLTGGQTVKGGANTTILWTSTDTNFGTNPIALSYSSDSGATWTVITAGTSNGGSYSWSVPNVDSTTYRVKIVATDRVSQTTTVTSTSNLKIDKTAPVVTLTSLTGGETLLSGSSQNITWTATDANFGSSPITLEYSSNSGSTWTTIVSNIANSGSYTWAMPSSISSTFRVRVTATDSVGWSTSSASTSNFTLSNTAPNLTQTTLVSPYYSNTATSVTFGGVCETGYDVVITGAESATINCPAGVWSWTTGTFATDAVRDYTFSQTNAVLTTSRAGRWVRDTVAPTVDAVEINAGDAYTPTPTVSVSVTTPEAGLSVRLANALTAAGSCQAQYANSNWLSQASTTVVYSHLLAPADGLKKVCAWAKDQAGNISVINPADGTLGTDMNTITYSSGNPPTVAVFEIINNSGGAFQGTQNAYANDPLKITWTINDVEGLANGPVFLDYTIDGTNWLPIEAGYGALSGNPVTYSADYYGFSAPANTFFRIRLRVKDVAGNTSLEFLSKPFNTYPWSVYAGSRSRGLGGSGKSASILKLSDSIPTFTMNPKTGDVYYLDYLYGIFKVSGATGIVSKFTTWGTSNVTGSGTISSTSKNGTYDNILFDNNGYLYLSTASTNASSNLTTTTRRVVRINPQTLAYTTYMAGGSNYGNAGTTASNVYVMAGAPITFDESNSMYFFSSCSPGTWTTGTSTARLMKVTQNPDGTAGTVSVVAGNCTRAVPTNGATATATGFTTTENPYNGALTVWDNGNKIYYYPGTGSATYKIINGIVNKASITVTNSVAIMSYNSADGKIYVANGPLKVYTPNLAGLNGDTEDVAQRILGTGIGDTCTEDDVDVADACITIFGTIVSSSGKVFFTDGGARSLALLRYVDENSHIQTLVGAKSYSGNGKAPSLTKGMFGGIYYKKAAEPHAATYPEGLYFAEFQGGVFGYFDTALGVSINLWGNQSGSGAIGTTGDSISPGVSFGDLNANTAGDARAMTFDNSGRPWLRYNNYKFTTIDENKELIYRSSASSTVWTSIAPGTNPQGSSLNRYGGFQNLTFSDNKLFLLGQYVLSNTPAADYKPVLRLWDYDNGNIVHLMGGLLQAQTAEQLTEGSLENKAINGCTNTDCAVQYLADQDRLYMAEKKKMRYIGHPMDPAHHTLVDIFDASVDIDNFTVSEDRKYIFYLKAGYLYCHAISAADNSAICKNTVAAHIKLGPPNGLDTIDQGPNQLTWKDNLTLYISTQKGEIYEYLLYH